MKDLIDNSTIVMLTSQNSKNESNPLIIYRLGS